MIVKSQVSPKSIGLTLSLYPYFKYPFLERPKHPHSFTVSPWQNLQPFTNFSGCASTSSAISTQDKSIDEMSSRWKYVLRVVSVPTLAIRASIALYIASSFVIIIYFSC